MVELKVFDEIGDFEPFQQKQFVQEYSALTKDETRKWFSLLVEFIRKKKCKKQNLSNNNNNNKK